MNTSFYSVRFLLKYIDMYRAIRILTIVFFLLQAAASTYILLVILFSSVLIPSASQRTPIDSSSLVVLAIFELFIFILPMFVIVYKLAKNQKIGWQIGVAISLIWLALQLITGKSEAFNFPIINLSLSLIGLTLYNKIFSYPKILLPKK